MSTLPLLRSLYIVLHVWKRKWCHGIDIVRHRRFCDAKRDLEMLHPTHSKKEGKDQELIQSSTKPDTGYQWESDKCEPCRAFYLFF